MLLTETIAEEIAMHRPMTFAQFMELALYHPVNGYYSGGRARVGKKGDFFTNVSVGSLYGRLLAVQLEEMWARMGRPSDFSIVEQGANGGDFAADVLGALRGSAFFSAVTYHIVEPLSTLAEQQRVRLREYAERVQWCESLDALAPFTGVHFSNELPDAFPVHVVKWDGMIWCERCVDAKDGRFRFVDAPLSSQVLATACAQIPQPLPPGYTTEVNLAAREWIATVAAKLVRGWVLVVDYGHERSEYYAPERTEGTLSAYANHHREPDPLARPGEIDLTAHVDFTSLIESAEAAGMKCAGFTDQHHFMVGLGVGHFADGANPGDVRAFQTLMHPQMMGMAFKVVCFARNVDLSRPLLGFRYAR